MSRQNSTALRRSAPRSAGKRSHARRHLSRCPIFGKVRFRDKREALEAVHAAITTRRFAEADSLETARQERRTYRCASCHGWHLTSQESRGDTPPAELNTTQGPPTGPIDKASGPRRVFLAIRRSEMADEPSIQSDAAFSDPPRPQGAWLRSCVIPPSQFGQNKRGIQ
jgi:hypothetical protein